MTVQTSALTGTNHAHTKTNQPIAFHIHDASLQPEFIAAT